MTGKSKGRAVRDFFWSAYYPVVIPAKAGIQGFTAAGL